MAVQTTWRYEMRELRKTVLSIVLLAGTLLVAGFCRGEKEPPTAVSETKGQELKTSDGACSVVDSSTAGYAAERTLES